MECYEMDFVDPRKRPKRMRAGEKKHITGRDESGLNIESEDLWNSYIQKNLLKCFQSIMAWTLFPVSLYPISEMYHHTPLERPWIGGCVCQLLYS